MALKVEEWDIERLIPYSRNPRRNNDAVPKMAGLIREFGFKVPVIIRSTGEVIDGHLRLKAAWSLGMTQIPVVIADEWTPAQVKAFRLAVNRSAEWAEWDDELLKLELDDLKLEDFDLDLIGFEDFQLEEAPAEGLTDADDVPDVQEQPVSRQGDIWLLGKHRLMCGDSTDAGSVALLMAGEKADMVFTDPPYGINVVSDDGKVGADFGVATKGHYAKVIADESTDTANKSYALCKEFSNRQIIWGGNYFLDFLPNSDSWLIWDKRCDSGIKNTFADGEMAWCSFHTPIRIYHQLWNGMIREGEHEKRVHPTQKPVQVLSEILKDFTKDGDTILDLFGGSGSTLIACEQTGRQCRMMELAPHYVDVIVRRWQDFTGDVATLEGDGRTFSEIAEERG